MSARYSHNEQTKQLTYTETELAIIKTLLTHKGTPIEAYQLHYSHFACVSIRNKFLDERQVTNASHKFDILKGEKKIFEKYQEGYEVADADLLRSKIEEVKPLIHIRKEYLTKPIKNGDFFISTPWDMSDSISPYEAIGLKLAKRPKYRTVIGWYISMDDPSNATDPEFMDVDILE